MSIKRSDVLAGLWNCSQPAMWFQLQPDGENLRKSQETAAWTASNIEESLKSRPYVDYYGGRCIKTDFSTFPKVDLTRFKTFCYQQDVSEQEIYQQCIQNFSVEKLKFGK